MQDTRIKQLLKDILYTKNWVISIKKKFWKIVPISTASIVFFTIISQITFMIAFLLPIKIIMILGSGGIPRYIPEWMVQYGYETLIMNLSLLVFVFYILHALCEKLINILVDKGTIKLLSHTNKSSLFENQEQTAFNAYMKYAKALAGLIFSLLVLAGLALMYERLFLFLMLYIVLSICLIICFVPFSEKFYKYLEEKTSLLLKSISNLGFFGVFLFIVYDVLSGAKLNFIIIIVSVILSRQLFSQSASSIQNLKAIYNQRIKINALFYHGHTLNHTLDSSKNSFWSILENKVELDKMISNILLDILNHKNIDFKYSWHELRVPNIVSFLVSFKEENIQKNYLIQIFNHNLTSVAKNQLFLLERENALNSLNLLGVTEIEKYNCHLFEYKVCEQIKQKEFKQANIEFMLELLSLEPKKEVVEIFRKSKPMIADRLHLYMLDRLSLVVVNEKQRETISFLQENFDNILSKIKSLPLQYINPTLGPNLIKGENNLVASFWGKWMIEPIGFNFPVREFKNLKNEFEDIKKRRINLKDITYESFALVVYLTNFERFFHKMNYTQAFEMLEEVARYYKIIKK